MKQKDIIKAYKVLEGMNTNTYPLKLAHDLYMLKKALDPHYQFQVEKEKEIYTKYSPVQTETGLDFGSKEKADAFLLEYNKLIEEMQDMEVDLDFVKPSIDLSMDIKLSMADMEALEPFVEFV